VLGHLFVTKCWRRNNTDVYCGFLQTHDRWWRNGFCPIHYYNSAELFQNLDEPLIKDTICLLDYMRCLSLFFLYFIKSR